MENRENRVPTQHDTVALAGRKGNFLVIGIDSINKTVEVRTTSASFVVVKDVPWATISYLPKAITLRSWQRLCPRILGFHAAVQYPSTRCGPSALVRSDPVVIG